MLYACKIYFIVIITIIKWEFLLKINKGSIFLLNYAFHTAFSTGGTPYTRSCIGAACKDVVLGAVQDGLEEHCTWHYGHGVVCSSIYPPSSP